MELVVQGCTVLLDDCDEETIAGWLLHIAPTGYVIATRKKKRIGLHRLIAGEPPSSIHVHHKNGSKLDNRRSNLQRLTSSAHTRTHNREYLREFQQWARVNLKSLIPTAQAREAYRQATGKTFGCP